MSAAAVAVALIGWYIAYLLYSRRQELPKQLAASFPGVHKLLTNKFYVDEIYNTIFVRPLIAVSKYFLEWVVDVVILGGAAWLLGRHCHARGRHPAALAVRQSAIVRGLARSRRGRTACICSGTVCLQFGNRHVLGGALGDGGDE